MLAFIEREGDLVLFKFGDNTFSLLEGRFTCMHLVVHMKSDSNSYVKNEKRELEKDETLPPFSPLHSCQLAITA